jgi:isoamylase
MRPEDWQNADGRLLCLRRAVRLDAARVELTLIFTNNTGDVHTFQLPDPSFPWWLRLNSDDTRQADLAVERDAIDVAPHSVQLLTSIVESAHREE